MRSERVWTEHQRRAASLAALGTPPATLRRLLDGYTPTQAWDALGRGVHRADPTRRYRSRAEPALIERVEASCMAAGVSVHVLGDPDYPSALRDDRQAPAVVFALGDTSVLDGAPRVAVIGTRGATPYGLGLASELGRGLSESGVVVVSGLAPGIEAAAHAGALAARGPGAGVAVLGTAIDAPGPTSQRALRQAVAQGGALLSEIPPGCPSAPWWFAVRNRVVAALAHVVVLVECHAKGGSLGTVSAAVRRGITVAAVPGSVRSSASVGTNSLLADGGAQLVRGLEDVLVAVELAIAGHRDVRPPRHPPARDRCAGGGKRRRAVPSAEAGHVRVALDQDPAPLDTIVRRCGLPLGTVALALEQLADVEMAEESNGWWCAPRR